MKQMHEPEGFADWKGLPLPPQSYLQECLTYDETTGRLTWKARPPSHFKDAQLGASWVANIQNSKFAGKPAKGHLRGSINGQRVYAHRVIWKLVYGTEPDVIDHIDGDPGNNVLTNLRSGTSRDNSRNMRVSKANTSGVTGVTKHPITGFDARIYGHDGLPEAKHFKTFDEAVEWRRAKEIEYGYAGRAA